MTSTGRQLAFAYAAALLGTVVLVATTFWLESTDTTIARRAVQEDQRLQEYLTRRVDTLAYIFRSYVPHPYYGRITTTVSTGTDSTVQIAYTVRNQLQEFMSRPGEDTSYLAVFSEEQTAIFASSDLTALSRRFDPDTAAVGFSTDTVLAGFRALARITPEQGMVTMTVFGKPMMLLAGRGPPELLGVSHFLVGTNVPPVYAGLVVSGGAPVLGATLLIITAAIMVMAAIFALYSTASRSLQPVEQIINEVQAITDGRSLHRRLVVGHSGSEIARLTTTLNAMMERLETSFTALRTFTADASHELNTPLAVLRADVERAMRADAGADEQMVALEEALREIRRMTDLVDSLLTLARADEGRLDMLRDRVNLTALTQDVYETALLLGEDAGLTVKLTTLEKAFVLGDKDRLRQLFLNLVSNAIKYTPRGGRVDLSLTERLDGIAFAVRDTGIGISQNDLARVFERFWRADTARSRASGAAGFGLGLPIGHWIAHAHGGTLTATSKMGRGSEFTVTLPHEGGELKQRSTRGALDESSGDLDRSIDY